MVRYWFSFTPLVVIGTVIILSAPWLGLIALMAFVLVALAALGALAWGIVVVPYMLVRSVGRRRHSRSGAGRQLATSATARPQLGPSQSVSAGAAAPLASPPSESDRLTWANYGAETSDSQEAPTSRRSLLVLPHERREGFWANIRGHVLELADPNTGYGLAPNPDDLFVVSIASELAWNARTVLRGSGFADDVRVSAKWRTTADPPTLSDVDLTISVSGRAEAASEALAAALDTSLARRFLVEPVARISWEGANR